ncbi:exosortase A [Propionivibrio sp.]|uniref:exosortase A n=1 Tax=Propionivibrio sp. TaxID=2212460 RepID=UPI0039E594D1
MQTSEIVEVPGRESACRWRLAIGALAAIIVAEFVLYRETALSMVAIWARSDTFAHGFLVFPISLWLIWRERRALAAMEPMPNAWLALGIGCAGFMWLLGEMATVAPLSQFALIGMLVMAVAAVLGVRLTRRMGFPLAFLLFAVPFGEFAMPQLMEWTANVTVLCLRFSGVPVYREGLHFIIPSGSWSVVEACSGVRYLIASLMVGTLFAYLNYQSLKRRLVFIGVSCVVPIIANWLRAYIIVMLGHLSGNRLAAGVDHLIYGWLFFGIVIMAMFWIGSRWREDDEPASAGRSAAVPYRADNYGQALLTAVLAAVVLTGVWPFAEWRIERNAKPNIATLGVPAEIPGWTGEAGGVPAWTPHYNNASAYLRQIYGKDGRSVGLYVGYYRNQGAERKMVSSNNVLVKSDDRNWLRVSGGRRASVVQGASIDVRTAELRSPANNERLVVWRWYWVNGRLTSSDYLAKAYTALFRLLGQGDDSAVVIAYVAKDAADDPHAVLQEFIEAAAPAIEQVLRKARDAHG